MELSEALKEKVHSAYIEQRLIGVIQYSENEYQELLAYTRNHSRAYAFGYGSYLYGDDEIIFATLVEIAKRWKSDDDSDRGFWQYVFKVVLDSGDNPKLWRAYTDLINNLEYCNKIVIANTVKKYYATIMMHAFAPYKSMAALFDFVYNIYKKDLDFNYTDIDRDICDIATEGFCNVAKNLGGRNVDVSIGSGAYGIKIGLRCLALRNETRKYFVNLLDRVLDSIDSLYHGNILTSDDYLEQLIKEWWEAKAEKDSTAIRIKRVAATTKHNISIKFIHKDCNVYLCIPPIRFSIGEEPNLWLSVYVENCVEPVIAKELFTQRGEITVTSVQQEIELNNILRNASEINFRVEITEKGKAIFNKTIESDFLLFDNERELTNRILKISNYFVYSLSIDDLQTPIAVSTIAKNLYNIYPTERETLCGRQKQVVFTNVSDRDVVSGKVQLIGESGICKWECKDKVCRVFGNRIDLLVPHSMSINGLELRIDANCILLSNLVPISEDEYYIFDITDLVPQRVPCELVVYSHLKEKEVIHNDTNPFGKGLCTNTELSKYSLHHEFKTDVAKIEFETDTSDYATMLSVMYAILNAFADALSIEKRDIKACLTYKLKDGKYSHQIIIYDSVPGGAGHSRRLVTESGDVLKAVINRAIKILSECDCEPSCYKCLRSYENQKVHEMLDRNKALDFLIKIGE